MRRVEVLHVLPSLVVGRTRRETEEALRQKGVGGGEWKGQSLITLASLCLLRKQTNLSHLSGVYMAGK